jgi:hypothetical protein
MMNKPGKNFLPYESKDVNFPAIVALAILLLMILGGTLFFGRFMDRLFNRFSPSHHRPASPLAEMNRLPPEPRLQVDSSVDILRLRERENALLNTYAWTNPTTGKVRIPIARAMAILAGEVTR